MNLPETLRQLVDPGVVAVIRADSSDQLLDCAKALAEGGIRAMEVTMTTPDALGVVRDVVGQMSDRVLMGVGTVLDSETARAAILAGARFVVTPVMRPEIIACCRRYAVPIVCGAYTPTEALAAHDAGADFIKIFPADTLGPGYMKALKAPLPQLRLIPTGGVDLDTAGDFIRAGCDAVAAGGSLVSKEILRTRDWETLTDRARQFVDIVSAARSGR